MKKSQVLAAIALAFALGVVAPVAMVNNASAFTVENIDENVKGAASESEVESAIAAVSKTYPVYDNLVAVSDLLTEIGTVSNGATKYDFEAGATTGELKVIDDIEDALSGITNAQGAEIDMSKVYVDGTTTYTNVEAIENAVAAANTAKNYAVYEGIYNAIEAKDNIALRKAIHAYNEATPNANLSYDSNVTVENFDTSTVTNYDGYKSLIEAVNDAVEAKNNYTKYFNGLANALKANDVLTAPGRTALANAIAETNPTVASLVTIATTAADVNANYTAWVGATNSVLSAVKAAQAGKSDFATENNYQLVLDIAKALKVAVPTPDKTAEEIAQTLVAYVIPTDPEGPNDTNKPGDADNKDDITNPGNTGVISGTNGTASSTVAVVAGIATALTAAGAGVVAYRNARREA